MAPAAGTCSEQHRRLWERVQAELDKREREGPNQTALLEHVTRIHTTVDENSGQLRELVGTVDGIKRVIELLSDGVAEAKAGTAKNTDAIASLTERVVGAVVSAIDRLAKREKRASDSLVDIAVESTRDARAYRSKRLGMRYKLALAILPIAAAALGRVSATAQCAHSPIPAGAQQSVSK